VTIKLQPVSLQAPPVQVVEQRFPVGMALSASAQKGQQLATTIALHSIGHQHLHSLAARRPPHPQAHSIQKQIRPVIVQACLMNLERPAWQRSTNTLLFP
jgi:hypothetical protein